MHFINPCKNPLTGDILTVLKVNGGDNVTEYSQGVTYEMLARALFENYESIYDIDLENNNYKTYHESESYRKLEVASEGEDFFASLDVNIPNIIFSEDREYVMRMLKKEALVEGLKKEKYYSFIYRVLKNDSPAYHQIRATIQMVGDKTHILMGVRNIDAMMRRDITHRKELSDMRQKEKTHMEAVLASAAAYMEVNLTKDQVLEKAMNYTSEPMKGLIKVPETPSFNRYSLLHEWMSANTVVSNNEKFRQIGSKDYLLGCFEKGEKRASVDFSVKTTAGEIQPCKEVFYLYKESSTDNIHSFCVIYDLTEQQKQEKELEELENELKLSRIQNSASQMQPHFLYNALGSIQEIVLTNPEYAADLIRDFTVHLRSCIRAMSNDEPLPFSQELKNIQAYINIEAMRLGEKLKVRYEIGTEDFRILPLSVQPLVENAIRHGVYERGMDGGTIGLRTREVADGFIIEVEDNGIGFDVAAFQERLEKKETESAGIRNIIFRLDKVMHASVKIESTVGVGTLVTIRVPKEAKI